MAKKRPKKPPEEAPVLARRKTVRAGSPATAETRTKAAGDGKNHPANTSLAQRGRTQCVPACCNKQQEK